ncbi:hypothetical protein [Nocardioides dongkuii]|uniref:hypothetical protein n=1 Tax=Nocardioides dongkuii TaxID=2760089 RepID=UPI0015FC5436|nr:hypothetical protein [Nocardioides dongkuii]
MTKVVVLAGPIAVGKTAVADALADQLLADVVSARRVLLRETGAEADRTSLQTGGRLLDQRTNGRWLLYALEERLDQSEKDLIVLDSARTMRQTVPILENLSTARLVYLEANTDARRIRYARSAASDEVKRSADFAVSGEHITERNILDLRTGADLRLDTTSLTLGETVEAVVQELGLRTSWLQDDRP